MKRRKLIILLGTAALFHAPTHAQDPARIYRLGILGPGPRDNRGFPAFFDELRRSGFVEGQNLQIDFRAGAERIGELVSPSGRQYHRD